MSDQGYGGGPGWGPPPGPPGFPASPPPPEGWGYGHPPPQPERTAYPRGTVAMANTGQPDSTGSQFFLCFVDTQLSPDYTAVGKVDAAGLAVLDTVAAAGDDGSFDPSPGGGKPKLPVTITRLTVLR